MDDPGVSVILRPNGAAVSVQSVANSPAQMAQLQAAYDGVASTYAQGIQDPFIQQFQQGTNPNDHANAEPQSIQSAGATGSSTPPSELSSSPQFLQDNSSFPLADNVQVSASPYCFDCDRNDSRYYKFSKPVVAYVRDTCCVVLQFDDSRLDFAFER